MTDKTRNIVVWTMSGLLAAAYMAAGSRKIFFDPEAAAEAFQAFGLPDGMVIFIGACEMAGAIGLLIPRLAGLAASGLVVIMLGAIYSHATHDPIANTLPPLVLGSLCGYVAWSRGLPFKTASA